MSLYTFICVNTATRSWGQHMSDVCICGIFPGWSLLTFSVINVGAYSRSDSVYFGDRGGGPATMGGGGGGGFDTK